MNFVNRLRLLLRNVIVTLCRWIGAPVFDVYTKERLTRGLVWAWGGRIHVIGSEAALIPVPVMQKRMTYWRQHIGFTMHPPVDFFRSESAELLLANSLFRNKEPRVLIVVLDHRSSEIIANLVSCWVPAFCCVENLLIAHGGMRDAFDNIRHSQKVFVSDPRLRTRDHQRESQSYRGVLSAVTDWLRDKDFTHVLFMEGDHVPLAKDLVAKYLEFLQTEDADVAGYHLARIDGTLHPHWLSSGADPRKSEVMLSMLGTGHFWKREAWDAVAQDVDRSPLYLELDLPTTAHANGFRIRPLSNPGGAVMALPLQLKTTDRAQVAAGGAWSMHPVKD